MNTGVSVVIPCYNHGRYLDETVDSVLKQTMQDFEIIIVNDGSTDEYTNKLLANYRRPKTTVYTVPNGGPASARNYGISKARARDIFPLDADDILDPTCLEKTTRVLEEDPGASIVNFWYEGFGDMDFTIGTESCGLKEILSGNTLCGNALFRKEVWEDVGGYDESFQEGYEDWDFWISALEKGHRINVIQEVLCRYRFRYDSRNYLCQYSGRHFQAMKRIIEKHRDSYRKYWLDVQMAREKCIGEIFAYQKELEKANKWYIEGRKEHERYISKLRAEIGTQERRIGVLTGKYLQLDRNYVEALSRQRRLDRLLQKNENELSRIYSSNIWRAGCALREAICSAWAMVLSPFRLVRKALRGHAGRQSGEAPPGDSR